mmetsp:Transcript_7483/g.11097  ORF Transcript_7483/g.11097 Transcript_7483/m.11097 type:complete len:558 (-) Transcript_7483:53-1726(-)
MAEKESTSRLHDNDPDFEVCINYLKTSTIHVTNPWHFLDPLRCYTLLYNAGVEKFRAKKYDLALIFFNFCQRINKKCKSYLFSVLIYCRNNKGRKALDLINKYEGHYDNPNYYVIRAILLHHTLQLREAIQDCDKAIKLSNKKLALAYLVKGDTLKLLPVDPTLPSRYYRRALKLEPDCGEFIGKGFQGDDEHYNWSDHFETLILQFHPLSERPDYLNYDQIINNPNMESEFVLHENNPFYKLIRGQVGTDPSIRDQSGARGKRKRRRKRLKYSKIASLIPSLMNENPDGSGSLGQGILDIEPLREYRQFWNEPSAFSRAKAREAHAKMRREQAIMFSKHKASPPEYDKPWRVNALLNYDKRIHSEHEEKDFRYYPLLSSSMAGKKHFQDSSSSSSEIKRFLHKKHASKQAKRKKWRLSQKKKLSNKRQKKKKKGKSIEEKMKMHELAYHPEPEVVEEKTSEKDTYFMKNIGMFSPILNNFFEGDPPPTSLPPMEPSTTTTLAPLPSSKKKSKEPIITSKKKIVVTLNQPKKLTAKKKPLRLRPSKKNKVQDVHMTI